MARRKVLIVGATGVVGGSALRHFAGCGDCEVIAVSRRPPRIRDAGYTHLPVDLTDSDACIAAFGRLRDVTHLVYAALYERPGGLVESWTAAEQMRVNDAMLRNVLDPLDAAAEGLRHVSILQGTKAYGVHVSKTPVPVPFKERHPRHQHENFYWLQEDYLQRKQSGRDWHWTIFRPTQIVGDAIGSNLNSLLALCVFGVLRREKGLALAFPGDFGRVGTMIDAEMLARAIDWAGVSPAARNETFNVGNGDVYSWEGVWDTLADALGMEVGLPERIVIHDYIAARQRQWSDIVRKFALTSPSDLNGFLGESARLADALTRIGHGVQPLTISSVVKLRQAGFHETIDTEDMIRKWVRRYQESGLIPPRR